MLMHGGNWTPVSWVKSYVIFRMGPGKFFHPLPQGDCVGWKYFSPSFELKAEAQITKNAK